MKLINYALSVVVAMLLLMTFFTFGPVLESKFFPVYSKFRILTAEEVPEGSRVVFEFIKYRNCEPQGFTFFNGELGQPFHQVMSRIENQAGTGRIRPLGPQTSNPYILRYVTLRDLNNTVFAEVYNRCHPLWLTRTKVYP